LLTKVRHLTLMLRHINPVQTLTPRLISFNIIPKIYDYFSRVISSLQCLGVIYTLAWAKNILHLHVFLSVRRAFYQTGTTITLDHIVTTMTLDHITTTMALDHIATTMALDHIVSTMMLNTFITFVLSFVNLLTSSRVMWSIELIWNFSVLQRVLLSNLVPTEILPFLYLPCILHVIISALFIWSPR
jgi:hypothetical protein